MQVYHEFTVDLVRRGLLPSLWAVQGDHESRILRLTLTQAGQPWQAPENITAAVRYRCSDGTGGWFDTLPDGSAAGSLSANVLTVTLPAQVFQVPGAVALQVELAQGEKCLSTFTLDAVVEKNPAAGAVTPEDYINMRSFLVDSAKEQVDALVAAGELTPGKSAYAYAVEGGFGGTEGQFSRTQAAAAAVTAATVTPHTHPDNAGSTGSTVCANTKRWFFSQTYAAGSYLHRLRFYAAAAGKVTVELWEKSGNTLTLLRQIPVEVSAAGEAACLLGQAAHRPLMLSLYAPTACFAIDSGVDGALTYAHGDLTGEELALGDATRFDRWLLCGSVDYDVCTAQTRPENVLTVGPGRMYSQIQEALDSITDDGTYTVLVYPQAAPYSRFSMIRRLDGAYPWTGSVARNVSVIALDPGHTVVRTDTNNYDAPPAELLCNGLIKGITFLSTYEQQDSAATKPAYAAHIDSAPTGAYTMVLENCRFIAHAAPAVGIGVHQDGHLVFKDCQFHALGQTDYAPHEGYTGLVSGYGGVYVHTSTKAGVTGQHITFDNCRVVAPNHTYGIALLAAGSFNAGDCEFTVTAHNTHIYAPTAAKPCAMSAGIILDPASWGNSAPVLNGA
ncbi:MAG: hypothetical protein IJB17_00720 [Oscillospiraceae bacterium]|nr:hypothetical protein [Oscillospiraceae bacterium]